MSLSHSLPHPDRARRSLPAWVDTFVRILLSTAGSYVTTSLIVVLLSRTLPGGPLSSALTATMVSFAVYAGCVIWTFAARSAWRAATGLLCLAALAGAGIAAERLLGAAA